MYDLIIRDATIITSSGRQVADIAVEGGKIAYVGHNPAGKAREEAQGMGCFVIPGVIDSQVRMRAPGRADAPEWARNSRSAVTGGVTTVFDLPDAGAPAATSRDQLVAKLDAAAQGSVCHYGAWVAHSEGGPDATWRLVEEGLAVAPLVSLDAADGSLAVGLGGLRDLVGASKGRLVGVHAELAELLDGDARPPEAAAKAVEAILALVQELDSPVHLTSLTTAAELMVLDPYRGDVPITSAVSPPHLFLSETLVARNDQLIDDLDVVPPVRPELDRRALWAAIRRGRIDVACSNHTPLSAAAKADGLPGMPGVGALFPMLMSAVKHGRMTLERLVAMCCEEPARIFGLDGKGHIAEGADADLVVMTEGDTDCVRGPLPWATVDWTPYVGREAGVAPKLVMVGGTVVARGGVLMDDLPGGRCVTAR